MLNHRLVGQSRGIMHFLDLTLFGITHIRYVRHSGNDIHIKLTIKTLLHDLHMKQTEESATETETQGYGTLRSKRQRGIVQLQLLQRGPQILIVCGINGIDAGKYHRLHFLETLNSCTAGISDMGNRITHLHLLRVLDAADNIAYVTSTQFLTGNHVHLQHTHLVGLVFHTSIKELHLVALTDDTIIYLEVSNNTTEGIEYRVENQCLKRSLLIAHGMRDTIHHGIQYVVNTLARLS